MLITTLTAFKPYIVSLSTSQLRTHITMKETSQIITMAAYRTAMAHFPSLAIKTTAAVMKLSTIFAASFNSLFGVAYAYNHRLVPHGRTEWTVVTLLQNTQFSHCRD